MKSYLSGTIHSYFIQVSQSLSAARTGRSRFMPFIAGMCAWFMLASAQAAFQRVESFDSLALGNISGQNGWVASAGSNEVVLDPAGGINQVLKVFTESGTLYKAASVKQGTTRMLFLRLRFQEHGRYSFGLSRLSHPNEYSDFHPELGMEAATTSDPRNEFRVANGLSPNQVYNELTMLLPGTWYNVWVLLDNTPDPDAGVSGTYEVWVNSVPGGDAQASDQLENDLAENVFGFRTATAGDLINFYIKTGGGDSPVDGRFYIDDIYLETTDAINLSNPADRVNLSGTVETADGTGICAMVLASGQYVFSCDPPGVYTLTGLPREDDGMVKRQVYAHGFFPEIDILADSAHEAVVMARSGTCPDYNTPYDPAIIPDSAGKRIDISGKVLLQDTQTPVCAMVLANEQYMFSCDDSGSYALNIPLDDKGQFKLQVYADGFAPAIQVFDEFKTMNDVRLGRAVECQ